MIYEDEILNENYSKYQSAYNIEMYIANTEGFDGEGNLLSKFGIEIRDQATFIVAKLRFERLVQSQANDLELHRPMEGDLVYLPLSNSLFEIKFVEHEKPFYRLSDLPTYQLQCELFEYNSEEFNTGIDEIDDFERKYATRTVARLSGGAFGFEEGERIRQYIGSEYVSGEVAKYTPDESDPSFGDVEVVSVTRSDSSIEPNLSVDGSNLFFEADDSNTGWSVVRVYGLDDYGNYIPEGQDSYADNSAFENSADDIIDFSEDNPFGSL